MSEKCEHCGASLKKYWHRLTPGLVRALAKLYRAVVEKGKNDIDINEEMDNTKNKLSHTEKCNWQKLRLHGLVARVREDGRVMRSRWLLTKRGSQFLSGKVLVPLRVQSFRNEVVDHDAENVSVGHVMRNSVHWEQDFDYDIFEPKQESLL